MYSAAVKLVKISPIIDFRHIPPIEIHSLHMPPASSPMHCRSTLHCRHHASVESRARSRERWPHSKRGKDFSNALGGDYWDIFVSSNQLSLYPPRPFLHHLLASSALQHSHLRCVAAPLALTQRGAPVCAPGWIFGATTARRINRPLCKCDVAGAKALASNHPTQHICCLAM